MPRNESQLSPDVGAACDRIIRMRDGKIREETRTTVIVEPGLARGVTREQEAAALTVAPEPVSVN